MANICDNRFFFCCENNSCKYINLFNELKDKFSYFMFDVIDYDDNDKFCAIEGEFESKWTFPANIFEDLDFKEEDDCYFRCLSEEYGCEYVAMNIYKDGEWKDEQCFDL
jgi:hypothetical protein